MFKMSGQDTIEEHGEIAFGKYLLSFLDCRGITQAKFAEKAKTCQPVISSICSGKRKCGLKVALRMADALELTGEERAKFLSNSNKPQWKGFNHELYGFEAMLYDFLSRELKSAGVDAKNIASIARIDKIEGATESRVIFVLKDGSVFKMNLTIGTLKETR